MKNVRFLGTHFIKQYELPVNVFYIFTFYKGNWTQTVLYFRPFVKIFIIISRNREKLPTIQHRNVWETFIPRHWPLLMRFIGSNRSSSILYNILCRIIIQFADPSDTVGWKRREVWFSLKPHPVNIFQSEYYIINAMYFRALRSGHGIREFSRRSARFKSSVPGTDKSNFFLIVRGSNFKIILLT